MTNTTNDTARLRAVAQGLLASDESLRAQLAEALRRLDTDGARSALEHLGLETNEERVTRLEKALSRFADNASADTFAELLDEADALAEDLAGEDEALEDRLAELRRDLAWELEKLGVEL